MNESNEPLFPIEENLIPPIPDEAEITSYEESTQFMEQTAPSVRPAYALNKVKKILPRLIMPLSFFLPFWIATFAYSFSMLYTDGKNMLLSSDGWHQYYPFLVTLREKLLSGGSMDYSWVVGMGGSFPSLFAYYLASPMYLLSIFVPLSALPHYFTLMTIVKLSLAGCFFAWFLRLVYRRKDVSICFFGLLYAFCAWSAGYYWNIMWLDTFALLPLLIAGTVCLLRDGKFRLYIIALALSLWCNYYIAFFCCIFVLLSFVGYCICCWNGFVNFLRRFLRIGICTLLGAGLACALLIPTLLAMQTTYSSTAKEFALLQLNIAEDAYGTVVGYDNFWEMFCDQTIPGIIDATKQVLTGLMPATEPTKMEGLPNVFCGLSTVILSLYFFCCKKISVREKLINLSLLVIIMLSFIIRWLDYVWHGFHFPNMLPYRFSFLFSFVLIAMAYRAYTLLDDLKPWHLLIIAPLSTLLIYNAYSKEEFGIYQQMLSIGIAIAMLVFFAAYYFVIRLKKPNHPVLCFLHKYRKGALLSILMLLLAAESVLSLAYGIDKVGFTDQYDKNGDIVYPRKNENVQALLNYLDDKQDDPLFYRTEMTNTQTLNDPALNGYNGVSIFNSSTNANFNRLSRSLGLASWVGSNRFVYYESSPFTNTMCGIKYLIDRSGHHYNTDYNSLLASSDNVKLLENDAFISVGFMANSELADFVAVEKKYNPIQEQEEMFRLATGIEDDLYEHISTKEFKAPLSGSISNTGYSGTQYKYSMTTKGTISIIYTLEEDGLYVATTKRPTGAESKMKVYLNNSKTALFSIDTKVRMIFSVGSFKKGDKLRFEYVFEESTGCSGTLSLDVARMNNDIFDAGLATLADEPFQITEFSDGYVRGTVDVLSDGLFYTSIPYEPGWKAYVDGNEVTLAEGYDAQNTEVVLSDAVICFPLTEGTHEIELVYEAPGVTLGLIISVVCLVIFITLWVILRKNPVLIPDKLYQRSTLRMSHKTRFWCLGIGSFTAQILSIDLIWVTIHGAIKGYSVLLEENPSHLFVKLLPYVKEKTEDEIFVLLSLIACVLLPYTIWLTYRFFGHVWKLLKVSFAMQVPHEAPQPTVALSDLLFEEEPSFGQEEPTQPDQAAEEGAE